MPDPVDQLLWQYSRGSVDTSFSVGERTYVVRAVATPDQSGPGIRWSLYEIGAAGERGPGLCFGMAEGVREALEDVVDAAREHATRPARRRRVATFRPDGC
jgi:hypothetical protein